MKGKIDQREHKMRARTEIRKQKSSCEILIVILKWVKKFGLDKLFLILAQNSQEAGV